MTSKSSCSYLDTPLGTIRVTSTDRGVKAISFVESREEPEMESGPPWHQQALEQLALYFQGQLKKFSLTLDPQGSDFQQKVWRELGHIAWGETLSYGELSQRLGDPKAVRAVGHANSKNPIAIVIPCHRVIGSNGDLVGYAGGLFRKKWLLKHEGALKQLELF
ncbi:MAG: methylated-DNA--[protein]-cysteine S-methyltransferase [Cyclobacteriaceae bacterium]|nr:methylated-DNA--[protein]-cysteine S-methyltransferase [Cyclobacteriaceae bacterium]